MVKLNAIISTKAFLSLDDIKFSKSVIPVINVLIDLKIKKPNVAQIMLLYL